MSERVEMNGSTATEGDVKPAIVKKYANRRLYNTATSSYVTLDELSAMVRKGEHFVVYDAKSGEDITRSVLTQIILEEDSKGRNLMPIGFLRQLISFYDDRLHTVVPRYLELSMENFAKHQDQMRDYVDSTLDGSFQAQVAKKPMHLRIWQGKIWHFSSKPRGCSAHFRVGIRSNRPQMMPPLNRHRNPRRQPPIQIWMHSKSSWR